MTPSEKKPSTVETVCENIANFAFDREDVKLILGVLPEEADVNRVTVEYELQILKIITVGWGISFYMENHPYKDELAERFWISVQELSKDISTTTSLLIGKDIDYFQILKERLNIYVKALNLKPDASEPAVVIGPGFAKVCKHEDDVYTIMTGSRLFLSTLEGMKEYLDSVQW